MLRNIPCFQGKVSRMRIEGPTAEETGGLGNEGSHVYEWGVAVCYPSVCCLIAPISGATLAYDFKTNKHFWTVIFSQLRCGREYSQTHKSRE